MPRFLAGAIGAGLVLVLIAGAGWGGYRYAASRAGDAHHAPLDRPSNVFDQHLLRSGIYACADMFGRLGSKLTSGAPYAVHSRWSEETGDGLGDITALVGMALPGPDGKPGMPAAGIVFSAGAEGRGCAGQFVRVTTVAATCTAFAKGRPHGATLGPALENLTTIELPSGEDVVLLPVQGSCVAITVKSD